MLEHFLWYWLQLQRSQWLSRRELERLQLKKLKKILSHSYEKVPFYRKFYDQHRVHPNDLKSLEDIRRFPIITKALARDTPLNDRTATDVDLSRCTVRATSGSTGIPVTVLDNELSFSYYNAYLIRRFLEYGYRPWRKIFRMMAEPTRKRSPDLTIGESLRGLMKKCLESRIKKVVMDQDIDKNLEAMKEESPQIVLAYPSYLRVIVGAMSERRIDSIKLPIIVTCGEVLDESSRALFSSSFGSQVYNGYGCIEVAPFGMAWECRERSGLHINSDSVLLEVLKDGEPVSPGESGEVVATSFFRFSTPMIRYRVGDIVTLSDEKCTCGREMPLIKNIEGRLVDFIKMPDGRQISPYAVMAFISYIPGIARYQIVQQNKNRIDVTIEKGKYFNQKTIMQLREDCNRLFGSHIHIQINAIDSFPIESEKKFRVVTSKYT